MYSDRLQDRFDAAGVSTGDRITVTTGETTHEGILMPRAAQGDRDALVLKFDNGYNIGINADTITDIELIEAHDLETGEQPSVPAYDETKPDIAVLHTGGTIASRVSYETGGVKAAFDPEDLLQMYPELFDEANITSEVIAQMASEDMEPAHWVQIAQAVAEHRKDADGIIIGHGTDTMAYTAAALSFMLENIDIPVVLVGAQRSSDRPSSDAAMNLLCATKFIQDGTPGVYVCMHESMSDTTCAIHRGTRVRKMHTSRRDAFESIDTTPVATVSYPDGEVTFDTDITTPSGSFTLRDEIVTDVGLLKAVPGIQPDVIEPYESYEGLVLEGTGLGHFPVSVLDTDTEHHEETLDRLDALADDALVVMTSQCLAGSVNMNVYDPGVKLREAGVIEAGDMLPGVAYVKVMWALGQTDSRDAAAELFTTNVAGEIQPRREYHE